MLKALVFTLLCFFACVDQAAGQPVRGAFPSPSIQILPIMVGADKGFYER